MVRVFANDPGDRGSFSGRVIPKTKKMVLNASLLNTQDVCRVNGAIPYTSAYLLATEKGAFGSPSTMVGQQLTLYIYIYIRVT